MDALLTTGDVARLCGVTPDAVLKWIKKGKLPATRTAGGHYRVSREACAALGLCASDREGPDAALEGRADREPGTQRCWEYFGQPGTPPEACYNCLVFRARVQHCYMLAELGEGAGHRCEFCRTECVDCPFYRASHGMATTVLVITRDEALSRRLRNRVDARKVSLHFARTAYDSSTLIGMLRPAVVVIESVPPDVRAGILAQSILQDDRVPGVKVFVARRQADEAAVGELSLPTVTFPVTADRIEQLVESVVTAGGRTRGDAA
jgi:excisionase family DNA binding protein